MYLALSFGSRLHGVRVLINFGLASILILKQILSAKSMQYLTDYHLWFSTLVKPSYSRFTRAQRLTCCLCLLISSTALSTAWYQYVGPPVSMLLSISSDCEFLQHNFILSRISAFDVLFSESSIFINHPVGGLCGG